MAKPPSTKAKRAPGARKTKLDLNPDDLPPFPLVVEPQVGGVDAIGLSDPEIGGVAIAQLGGMAQISKYGVAFCPNGGKGVAEGGAQGVAVLHGAGTARAGDASAAYAWTGSATVDLHGAAFSIKGEATVADSGVAVVLLDGSAEVGTNGVACALNKRLDVVRSSGAPSTTISDDPTAGLVRGGKGSVVVAFNSDGQGTRYPVVGFIGIRPSWLDQVAGLEDQLLAAGVQFGMDADKLYRLTSGKFKAATAAMLKKRQARIRRNSARK